MTRDDLVFALQHLSFRQNGLGVLKLDRSTARVPYIKR
jgi:hypothetical protein